MGEMDLIPSDYRQNLNRYALLRNFIWVCVLVILLLVGARALLGYLIWRENVMVVSLEQQESLLQQTQSKAESYQQQKQVTQQQLSTLDALRGGDRVNALLLAIDAAYHEGIWFDSVHFLRQSGTKRLDVPGAENSGIIVAPEGVDPNLDISQNVQIVGHAINHSILAEFMRALGAQESIADLRLIDTASRNYVASQVIDFNLSVQMHKEAKTQVQP